MIKKHTLFLLLTFPITVFATTQAFVSVMPLKYFVHRIAGKQLIVHSLVTPGQTPETYAPTPQQMTELSNSKLYYRIGVPFETTWLKKIKAINPKLKIIDLRDGIELQKNNSSPTLDPHIWNSPVLAKHIAKNIYQSLINIDPKNQTFYYKNYLNLSNKLTELHHAIWHKLNELQCRTFLVFHPAWGYFANTYHLRQIAIEQEGKSATPQTLTNIIKLAKKYKLHFIVVSPQISHKEAAAIAREINAKLVVLDPLAYDYLNNMKFVAETLSSLLQCKKT